MSDRDSSTHLTRRGLGLLGGAAGADLITPTPFNLYNLNSSYTLHLEVLRVETTGRPLQLSSAVVAVAAYVTSQDVV